MTPNYRYNTTTIFDGILQTTFEKKTHVERYFLGSSSWITNAGGAIQYLSYDPWGSIITNQKASGSDFDAMYTFLGMEYDSETGYNFLTNRHYWAALGMFLSVDPLADKFPWITPYHYASNNPINRSDPSGLMDDWVQNNKTGGYEWHDNVTSPSNTPSGYSYVGANANDILTNMGISSQFETQMDKSMGMGPIGGDGVGPMGNGVFGGSVDFVQANISVTSDVSYNSENISTNNQYGKTFNGVTVNANVSQLGTSNDSFGSLSVSNGATTFSDNLKAPSGSIIYQTGTKPSTASVNVPANVLKGANYLQSATIKIGYRNGNIFQQKTNMTWNLQSRPMFRQGR